MKTNLFVLIIFFSIILSCKKEEETYSKKYNGKISTSLYPFLFDIGSYWVYKDTIANSIDSIILSSITKSTFDLLPSTPGQGSRGSEEYFDITYYSFLFGRYYKEQLLGYIISRGLCNGGYVLLSSKRKGDKSLNAEIVNVFDSLKIAGKTYKNVVKMKITKDYYIENDYNFYYVDSVGVIRKEKTNNGTIVQAWNLLRFKSIMYKYQ